MLLRKTDLDGNAYGLLDTWLHGGYSDDMQVQATAQDHGRKIATPLTAIVPNRLKGEVSLGYAWDFLKRQNFVLYTYGSAAARKAARHFSLGLHELSRWPFTFAFPALASAITRVWLCWPGPCAGACRKPRTLSKSHASAPPMRAYGPWITGPPVDLARRSWV